MKHWGGKRPPSWVREIADDRARPMVVEEQSVVSPRSGDIVLKPVVGDRAGAPRFRVETWDTHDLLDGPFEHVRQAMESAFELGVTARLTVWLDYSLRASDHELDSVPLYFADVRVNADDSAPNA